MTETFYDVLRRQGITRRSFLKFCSLTATSLGLGAGYAPRIAHALETKPRTPVVHPAVHEKARPAARRVRVH